MKQITVPIIPITRRNDKDPRVLLVTKVTDTIHVLS